MGLPLTSHNIPLNFHYPLVMTNSLLLKPWPIEIVDLPNLKMVIFNSYVTMFNYQRVYPIKMGDLGVPPWITKPLLGPHRGTAQIIGHPSSIPPMPRKQTFGEFE